MATLPVDPAGGTGVVGLHVCHNGPPAPEVVPAPGGPLPGRPGRATARSVLTPRTEPRVGLKPYCALIPSPVTTNTTRGASTAAHLRRSRARRKFTAARPSTAKHPTTHARVGHASGVPTRSSQPSTTHSAPAPAAAPARTAPAAVAGQCSTRRASRRATVSPATTKAGPSTREERTGSVRSGSTREGSRAPTCRGERRWPDGVRGRRRRGGRRSPLRGWSGPSPSSIRLPPRGSSIVEAVQDSHQ